LYDNKFLRAAVMICATLVNTHTHTHTQTHTQTDSFDSYNLAEPAELKIVKMLSVHVCRRCCYRQKFSIFRW